MNPIIRRQKATQASIDQFRGRLLRWGINDCSRLARFHLHQLGVSVPLLKGVRYRSKDGAEKALDSLGFETLSAAVDAVGFARIAPASAWLGDLVALPAAESDGPFDISINVAVGNGRLLGLHDGRFAILQPALFAGAWRVPVNG